MLNLSILLALTIAVPLPVPVYPDEDDVNSGHWVIVGMSNQAQVFYDHDSVVIRENGIRQVRVVHKPMRAEADDDLRYVIQTMSFDCPHRLWTTHRAVSVTVDGQRTVRPADGQMHAVLPGTAGALVHAKLCNLEPPRKIHT